MSACAKGSYVKSDGGPAPEGERLSQDAARPSWIGWQRRPCLLVQPLEPIEVEISGAEFENVQAGGSG